MFLINTWRQSSVAARASSVALVMALVAAFVAAMVWTFEPNYEVLFSGLGDEDASTMTAELDKMKVPYRLQSGGSVILVPSDQMLRTRMKLVGKNLPLHGSVGFEVFNNSDLGMTDFTQRVNYQRALQGELTRTILSLDGVQAAKVLLVLPDTQVYRRDQTRPKASVNLALKPGHVLDEEQIVGIQRLVSAAAPDIGAADVTITDQRGVALSGVPDPSGASGAGAGGALDLKRRTEDYFAAKLNALLAQSFGPGHAFASVDVSLNMDRVHTTTDSVLPAASQGAAHPAGVLVRERESHSGDAGTAPLPPLPGSGTPEASASASQRDAEYQVGREVRDVLSSPGAITRIAVAAVVSSNLDATHTAQLRQLISNAAGLSDARGDSIAVYPIDQVSQSDRADVSAPSMPTAAQVAPTAPALAAASPFARVRWWWLAVALAACAVPIAMLRRRAVAGPVVVQVGRLDDRQRKLLQKRVQHWISTGEAQSGEVSN